MIEETRFLRTAIYIRVSTEEQAKEGFSINAQKEKLKQYALARDWSIYDFYIDDGISGKNIVDRPEINRMLRDIEDGKVDNVLIYKIDRLTRSTKNLIELVEVFNENKCAFNSLMESIDTSTATGRMFIKIVGIFAEFERENLAERVSLGFEQKAREGNYINSNGVYGYDYIAGEGKLIINEEEKKIIEYIYNEYLSGVSMTKITKHLRDKQVPTKKGGQWFTATILFILTNPVYIGKVRYDIENKKNKSFEVDGDHEHILSDETFYAVQEIISKRRKNEVRGYPTENAIFLGTLFCAQCGMRMGIRQNVTSTGKIHVNYYCSGKVSGKCDTSMFSQLKMDKAFLEYIATEENFEADKDDFQNEEKEKQKAELEGLRRELTKTEEKINEFRNMFIQERITFEEYRAFSGNIERKILLLKEELEKHYTTEEEKEIDFEEIREIIGDMQMNWQNLTDTEKGQFMHRFIEFIKAYSDNGKVIVTDMRFSKSSSKVKKLDKVKSR